MIIGRDLLKPLGLNLKLLKKIIEGRDELFERCTALMVDLCMYDFK